MSDWISKAVNVFRKDTPEAPQSFSVDCECGQQHAGIRRSRHQHLVCKSCGISLFVLPKDVYPQPHPNWAAKTSPREEDSPDERHETDQDPGDSEQFDLDAPLPSRNPTPRPPSEDTEPARQGRKSETPDPVPVAIPQRKSDRRKERGPSRRKDARTRRREDVEDLEPRRPGILTTVGTAISQFCANSARAIGRGIRNGAIGFIRFWTPLRLIFAAILLMIFSAIGYSVRQSQRETAGKVIREQAEGVQEALQKQDWLTASQRLEPVVAALDRLGRYDAEANLMRQQFRETYAISHLSGVSLFDLIQTADDIQKKSGSANWEQQFQSAHEGDWLIIEGYVQQVAERLDGRITKGYQLDLPWHTAQSQKKVNVRADLSLFAKLGIGTEPQMVIFAAPLKSCALDRQGENWRVDFDGERGFLWVTPETYVSQGFSFDAVRTQELIQGILDQQSLIMEKVR